MRRGRQQWLTENFRLCLFSSLLPHPSSLFLPLPSMSNFVVSARKYRPTKFEEVVGQQHVAGTLKNALATDHVAHAFLFCGPRGVGKTTCARILAKILNCENRTPQFEACNECASCRAFNENASFNIFELDAASNNGVEHIRSLVESVRIPPQGGKFKIYVIDEVHMLSAGAFNAFLKTLEEPPPYAIFILATTEKHKIIPTILSRCQIFDFRRITIADMVEHLKSICEKEGIEAEEDALHIIAQKADGALRDALSIFDRITSFSGKKIKYDDVIENMNVLDYDYFFQMTDGLLTENLPAVLNLFDQILRKGFEPDIFINGLAEHLRNVLVCKDVSTLALLEVSENLRERYRKQADFAQTSFILTALNICNDCDVNFKMARHKKLHVEMALIKMTFVSRAVRAATFGTPAEIPEKKTLDLTATLQNEGKIEKTEPKVEKIEALESVSINFEPPIPTFSEPEPEKFSVPPPPEIRRLGNANRPKMTLLDFENAVEKEEAELAARESKLNLENAKSAWLEFSKKSESDSLRLTMNSAEIRVEGENVIAKVDMITRKNMLMEEINLLTDFFREQLHDNKVKILIEVDEAKKEATMAAAPKKQFLSAREKLEQMNAQNPLVSEFVQRFELQIVD